MKFGYIPGKTLFGGAAPIKVEGLFTPPADLVNSKYAIYTCDQVKVISIRDRNGVKRTHAIDRDGNKYAVNDVISRQGIEVVQTASYAIDLITPESAIVSGIRTTYYPSGQVRSVTEYRNKKKHGLYICYSEQGIIEERSHMIDGECDHRIIYHKNGTTAMSERFVNGEISGLFETWDTDGVCTERTLYKDGEVQKHFTPYYDKKINTVFMLVTINSIALILVMAAVIVLNLQ
ncbi:hypothetical protein KDA11_05235 [Candidatus Saccharibacteria bacterium]|nr:hypothetical protein [Candidatus Saccharibacteria bacterium]